jgi:hypothetical protein
MQYALDLTRALTERIQELVVAHHGQLVVFHTDTASLDPVTEQVYVLNQKFYRVSKRQLETNRNYVNRGFAAKVIPLTLPDWRVSAEDGHLNTQATDLVMSALAEQLRRRITDGESVELRHR